MITIMKYLAVLGRQPKISLAELESLYSKVQPLGAELATFESVAPPHIGRLGGSIKLAQAIELPIIDFLQTLPTTGKISLGVSDYSRGASAYGAQREALKFKRILMKFGHSVRVIPNKTAAISSASSFHNHLFLANKIELIKVNKKYYQVIGVQNIDAYTKRDQARPARDARVGMLPPKLAQILINLCGVLPPQSTLLDPFCGTGVVLQEAMLMGLSPYGTDINERMIEYSKRNLEWLQTERLMSKKRDSEDLSTKVMIEVGDAQSFRWQKLINAVACETYLGPPMSLPPADIKLKQAKQECKSIILGFLKNLATQIDTNTPVVIAVPAWLRPDGSYERLKVLDEISNLGYNVRSFRNLGQNDLLYYREGQVVAREIIVLRKR